MSLAATQLRLYIDSNRTLFKDKQSVWSKLARRKARRDYHHEQGTRAFRSVVDRGARAYVTELGISEKWSSAFSTDDRNQTAKTYEKEFRERYSRGDLDALLPVKLRPKRRNVRGNPIRSGHDRATIRYNIETQRTEGKSMPKAIAIALSAARDSYRAEHPGGKLPAFLREPPKAAPKKKATKKRATKKTATKKKATKKKTRTMRGKPPLRGAVASAAAARELARSDRAYRARRQTVEQAQKELAAMTAAQKGPTLTQALKRHGFTHKKAGPNTYAHNIYDPGGRVVFKGTAGEVWAWLHVQERAMGTGAKKKKRATKKRGR